MWTYDQSSGKLSLDGAFISAGYSGLGRGKNNPSLQAAKGIGPIPCGLWSIDPIAYNSANTGPYTIILAPAPETNTFGRSGFRIHGDSIANPGTASHGCIIMPRNIRNQIIASKDYQLTVVE